jgi:hypothetical protein
MSTAQPTTGIDDERVRVTTWTGRAGTEHDVVNASGTSAVFVEIEFKRNGR